MNRQELLEQLTEDILTYVMHGSFPEDKIAEQIKPQNLDQRFNHYGKVLDLHFVLKPEIVEFVEALPKRLRDIKTQTKSVSETYHGSVKGRINWSSTIQKRYSRNPSDNTLFVCDNRSKNYDVDENIVLKKLLSIIYTTIKDCQEYLSKDYDWITERWKKNEDLIEEMNHIFERNINIKRIRSPKEYEPTEKMLISAEESRRDIYRESARHLRTRQDIFSGDRNQIRELLDKTSVTPDDDETLLELYVLFRFISTIEYLREDTFELNTIATGSQEIARMTADDGIEIVLYHDNSGGRELSFISDVSEKQESELSRTEYIQRESQNVVRGYFKQREFQNHTKRPDVIVLEIRSEDGHEYLITEVKNSSRIDTIRTGIKETLEYLAFLKYEDEYVFVNETGKLFGNGWNGMLVIQDLDDETTSLENQSSIKILQASEVKNNLREVLETVLRTEKR